MADIFDKGGKITIGVSEFQEFFVRRDRMIQTEGSISISVSLPSPQNATLARMINGSLFMQKLTTDATGGRAILTCSGGKELVGVRLYEHEHLAVSFSHIVGFSKKPRFASFANLSVAAFACDRNFATVVSGPAKLVLETNGNHVIHNTGTVVLEPDQLIAWDPATRFRLDRISGLTDLYLNRVRISCFLNSELLPVIADSVPRKGKVATNPLWGFVKSIYWPRFH